MSECISFPFALALYVLLPFTSAVSLIVIALGIARLLRGGGVK